MCWPCLDANSYIHFSRQNHVHSITSFICGGATTNLVHIRCHCSLFDFLLNSEILILGKFLNLVILTWFCVKQCKGWHWFLTRAFITTTSYLACWLSALFLLSYFSLHLKFYTQEGNPSWCLFMETLFMLLALCEENYHWPVDSPHKGSVIQSLAVSFDVSLNKAWQRLDK